MSTITQKVCLLGDFNVGKTSLVRRFVDDKFSDKYLSTVGVKVSRRSINLQTEESDRVDLLLWDLEGNTKFKSITPTYLKGSSGSIIVADLTRANTMSSIKQHAELFLKVNPKGEIIVALNKADLVPQEKLDKLVDNYRSQDLKVAGCYQTSAKTGRNVVTMFEKLAAIAVSV